MRPRATRTLRPRRASREPVVPMINIVFLLLIFFLMTAQIAPPTPFDVVLPSAEGDEDSATDALYLSAQGEVAFGTTRGDTAVAAAVAAHGSATLRVVADANLSAATLAKTLAQLAALGATRIELVTGGA